MPTAHPDWMRVFWLAVVMGAVAVWGCGGSDGASAPPTMVGDASPVVVNGMAGMAGDGSAGQPSEVAMGEAGEAGTASGGAAPSAGAPSIGGSGGASNSAAGAGGTGGKGGTGGRGSGAGGTGGVGSGGTVSFGGGGAAGAPVYSAGASSSSGGASPCPDDPHAFSSGKQVASPPPGHSCAPECPGFAASVPLWCSDQGRLICFFQTTGEYDWICLP